MKKNTKAVTDPCGSTTSGMTCNLARGHEGAHTDAERGKKQHGTWIARPDGQFAVTAFTSGKKMSDWIDPAPKSAEPAPHPITKAGYCGQKFEGFATSGNVCTLVAGHAGLHENTSTGIKEVVDDANAEEIAAMDADAAARANLDGDDEDDDPYQDEVRSDDDRAFAGQQREAREAHALELDGEAVSIQVHPAADALPLIEGAEFDALVEDIRVNGLHHKPVLDHSGRWLVDGRNRKRACEALGIAIEYERLPEGANIAAFVISTNLKRRHLTESQRAMIAAEIANLSQGRPNKTGPGAGFTEERITQAEAAAGAGVGERTVRRANAVRDTAVPELVQAVKQGKVDLKGAEQVAKLPPKQQRKIVKERIEPAKGPVRGGTLASLARQEERRSVVAKINSGKVASVSTLPPGFGVLLWDPPWEYRNSDDHPGVRGHIKYPPMTLGQLVVLGREALERMRDDAVIITWATNPRMPVAVHLIEALGLEWQSMGTWVKEQIGCAPLNMRSRTEHYIVATRGKPTHTLNEVSTWLGDRPLPRNEHSEKPPELHELVEAHCSGPFLELFGRAQREGWTVWGAEAEKFATEAA